MSFATQRKPWDFVGLSGTQWVDLPRFSELQAEQYLGSLREDLRKKVNAYQAVIKSEKNALGERADRLELLAEWLRTLSYDVRLEMWISCLTTVAEGKSRYCRALDQIYREKWHEDDKLAAYHQDASELGEARFRPLTLTRERYFWPEKKSYWGDYWMETLDPCHRHLPHLHRFWQEEHSGRKNAPHFLLWLEDYAPPGSTNWTRYFSREEAAQMLVVFNDGRLMNSRRRPLSCPERQHFFFVIGLDLALYACRAEPHICHSSFTRGMPVLASGALKARDGVLNQIKFESGHYIAGPNEWWQAMQLLLAKGISCPAGLRVTVYDRFRYVSRLVQLSELNSAAKFFQALGVQT